MIVAITVACVFGVWTVAVLWLLWCMRAYIVVWDGDEDGP